MSNIKYRVIAMLLSVAMLVGLALSGNRQEVMASYVDAQVGQLHVDGTVLKDGKGNVVQLRGVSTHGLSWFPEYVNEQCFKDFHDIWGANVVRLAMYSAEWNGYCTGDDENRKKLKNLVKNGVEYAKKNNMYVIVDWHILSDGDPMQNVEQAKSFWKDMSADLASYTNVLYEICNEPNGGGTWEQIKKYANQVIPIIRKNDSDAVIIVGTPTWSQEVDKAAADPLKYDNIMYTLHFYANTHQQWLRDRAEAAIKGGLPIFVTEFGICDASGNGYNNKEEGNKWISFLDKYNVSYVAWNLSNKDESSSLIKSSCKKTSGLAKSDLSESGSWFYDVLVKRSTASVEAKDDTKADTKDDTKADKKSVSIDVKKKFFSVKKSKLSKSKLFSLKAKSNSGAKLSYKKISGSKYLSVTKKGYVKIKAKTPKGNYKIKIKITAVATGAYESGKKTVTVKIKVR